MSARVPLPLRLPLPFAGDDDRALLARFADHRDGAAFAALVGRHARMVYGVCRRAVRDAHLAEDAFQAVFLVLSKKPRAAIGASSVGGWLFGIARRVGLAARRHESRRAGGVSPPSAAPTRGASAPRSPEQPDFDDLLRVLDEELAALPDAYRAPLIACFLEERTQDEAAKQLGWSLSTLRRRLDRAKELLRARLTRRGATLAAGLFAGVLAPSARAAVPARLLDAPPSPLAGTLAAEVTRGSLVLKLGLAAAVVVATVGGVIAGLGAENGPAPELRSLTLPARLETAPAPRVVEPKLWVPVAGRVVFPETRDIPAAREVPGSAIKDADFFGQVTHGDVRIDLKTRGIANAVVWLRPDSDDRKAAFPADKIHPDLDAKPADRVITAGRDGFSPRVNAVRAGDRLVFTNPAPIAFNVRYQTPNSGDGMTGETAHNFNVLVPPGKSHTSGPLPVTRFPDVVGDAIHPWVQGYVWAFDHPYFAVTDATGRFAMTNVPAGTWRLVVWHEKVGYLGGAKGRLGTPVTVAPDGRFELHPLVLESDGWGKD